MLSAPVSESACRGGDTSQSELYRYRGCEYEGSVSLSLGGSRGVGRVVIVSVFEWEAVKRWNRV